jgi:hypothetical protein
LPKLQPHAAAGGGDKGLRPALKHGRPELDWRLLFGQ